MLRKLSFIPLLIAFAEIAFHTALLFCDEAPDFSLPPLPPESVAGGFPPTLVAQAETHEQDVVNMPETLSAKFMEATKKTIQTQNDLRNKQTRDFYDSRTSVQRWNSLTAIPTPIPQIRAFRHEETNIPILPNSSLPGAQDPNDNLNHVTHGTSSLHSYELSFGSMGARQRAIAAASGTNPFAMSGTASTSPFAPFDQAAPAQAKDDLTDNSPLTIEIGMQVRPGIRYDTGFSGSTKSVFNPGTIALPGTPDSHKNGQIYFFNNPTDDQNGSNGFIIPYRPQAGITLTNGMGTSRAYTDLISSNDGSNLKTRTAVLQYVDPGDQWVLIFGQAETVFGDLGSAPSSLITGGLPVGTISTVYADKNISGFTGVSQLRIGRFWHNVSQNNDLIETAVSAEDPILISNDYAIIKSDTDNSTIVQRYPTFVGRIRYQGSNLFDSYQIAALAKPFVMENNKTFHETSATGYGVSANARFEIGNNNLIDTVYFGAAGGQGIGGYIFGNMPGAVATTAPAVGVPDSLTLLNNFGGYGSYRHVWYVKDNGNYWSSNFMGGTAQSGDPGVIPTAATDKRTPNRILYQAGCNLLWHSGANSTIGMEYQYGSRLAVPTATIGSHGEDHQVMLVLQFGIQPAIKQGAPSSATKNATAARSFTAQDAASAASADRTSRLRF